jgi:hypothetical protein
MGKRKMPPKSDFFAGQERPAGDIVPSLKPDTTNLAAIM